MTGRHRGARARALVLALVLSLLSAAHAGAAVADSPPDWDPDPGYDRPEQPLRGPAMPGEWKARQDLSIRGTLPARALLGAASEARRVPSVGGTWSLEGPTNIGGRITGLAVDPVLPDTVYAAAASGGVWKSTDAATTFSSIWPDHFPQATGAIAMGADGVLYVGTGEAQPGGGSLTYEGDGVYRSTDRGRTWQHAGLRDSATIGAIAIDPSNPKRVFVAATGSLFNPGGDRGLYRSTDGGTTWERVLAGPNEWTGAVDVAIDPSNPNRVFAALWERQRTPSLRRYGGLGSGLYRSTDGGTTWQRLENVIELTPGDATGLKADVSLSRIGIGIAPSDPRRVYVITATWGAFGDNKGFYRSDDGGDTFTATTHPRSGLGWWTGKVWVDPTDPDRVFVAGVALRLTNDGGRTWGSSAGLHVDHHAMAWDPKVPGRVYEGNDGGVYRSEQRGSTRTWIKAAYEPYTQFYTVAVSAQDPARISGGTQDNGSLRSWNGPRFNEYYGGDGEQNLINPKDFNIVYACLQFGNCARSTDAGDTMVRYDQLTVSDRRNWLTPVEFHPGRPEVLYYGGNRLNRSTDGGVTWEVISPDLTGGPGDDPVYPFGTLTTVAGSRRDAGVIYAGTDDGRLWVTRDGGERWRLLLEGQPWVTRVKVHDRLPGWVFATFSGYRAGSGTPHVRWSPDGGRTWIDVSGNLPDAPVNDVVISPAGRLYVATDVGVFVSLTPVGKVWRRLGRGLPLAPVYDIEYHAGSGRVFAATFGRGIYSAPAIG